MLSEWVSMELENCNWYFPSVLFYFHSRKNSLVVRTQLSVRVHNIIGKFFLFCFFTVIFMVCSLISAGCFFRFAKVLWGIIWLCWMRCDLWLSDMGNWWEKPWFFSLLTSVTRLIYFIDRRRGLLTFWGKSKLNWTFESSLLLNLGSKTS